MLSKLTNKIKLKLELRDIDITLKALSYLILENGWNAINTQTINKWHSLWNRKDEILKELNNV